MPTSGDQALLQRLDRASWSRKHTWIFFVLGVVWALDAFEVTVVGNTVGILERLWHLSALQGSFIISLWLIGIMVGAVAFGYVSDRYGRKAVFSTMLFAYALFTLLTALSTGYTMLLVFRFATAIGIGAEYSAVNAAIAEFAPARHRGRAGVAVMAFWPVGGILAALTARKRSYRQCRDGLAAYEALSDTGRW